MVVRNVLQGHGDPLLLEVVGGLEKMKLLHPELETKNESTAKGTRGLGERHSGIGDPLFKDAEHYHQVENDHVAEVQERVALHERILKREKHNSLALGACSGAKYDPILREYVLPKAKLAELKAIEADINNKRGIFREMSLRKRHNLNEQELYCDPLVNSYRMKALMFGRGNTKKPLEANGDIAVHSTFRKLNKGDPLFTATNMQQVQKSLEAVECTYRKINGGDELLNAMMNHEQQKR